MADVDISIYRAQVVRAGSTPASPGFAVAEGQNPVDPSGSGQTHLPVTIATATTGLSITESQILSGAGLVSQYIRGDGSLADFPASTGGGSSVSYYLNGSVSQGTIGGVAYKQLNRTPVFGAGTDFTINANGYIASFITDASDPNKLLIPAGNWNFETYFSASSNGGSPSFYVELYKYDGTSFTLIATSSSAPELIAFGTSLNPYYSTLAVPQTALALTDRLAIRYFVTHSGRTITLHTEDNHLCQIITTFTTGLTALNGLTAQVQNFAVGTSGTDFAIASATATHTFNLPTASATNRGALSSADWTTFNNKTSNLGTVTSVGLSSATSGVTIGSTPVTTSGTITLAIATASGSQNGLLSSTDWTTFNGKQNALTNPVTGTGTSGQVAYFTGTTAISSESNLFWDATNNRLGIASSSPDAALTVSSGIVGGYGTGTPDIAIRGNVGGNATALQIYRTALTGGDIVIDSFRSGVGAAALIINAPNGGNVLIGTTADNGEKFQVSGKARFTSAPTLGDSQIQSYSNSAGNTSYGSVLIVSSTGKGGYLTVGDNSATTWYGGEPSFVTLAGTTGAGIKFRVDADDTKGITIPTSGNVGIGTNNPSYGKLVLVNATQTTIALTATSLATGYLTTDSSGTHVISDTGGLSLATGSPGSRTDRLNISSAGQLTMDNSLPSANIAVWYNSASSNPFGLNLTYTGASPNGTSNGFLYLADSSALRCEVRSNGGIANYATNNVVLSDERLKKNIEPLESYWDKFKAIEIVKYKYIDQTHDDFNIGVIAQQVESVAPEFVDIDGWDNNLKLEVSGNEIVSKEQPLKSVYSSDLHHATIKVLQEAMQKIELMQKEIDILKN